MKKALSPLLGTAAIALSLMFSGCKTDETDNISIVRDYPAIQLNGRPILSVPVGSTYTDAGATTTLRGATINTTVRGSVDTSTPGVYYINYVGRNPEGDSVTASRIVGVIDPAVTALDLTGTYVRAATGGVAEVTKVDGVDGLYVSSNVGGIAANNPSIIVPAYFFHITPTTIDAPEQMIGGGTGMADITSEELVMTGSTVTAFKWRIIATAVFGTALRTFEKQ